MVFATKKDRYNSGDCRLEFPVATGILSVRNGSWSNEIENDEKPCSSLSAIRIVLLRNDGEKGGDHLMPLRKYSTQ